MASTQNTFKISLLKDLEKLDGNDLFLVSDHTNNNFYTRKLSASVLFEKILKNIILHINSENYINKLAAVISNAISATLVSTTTPIVTSRAIDLAVPLVSALVLPIVSTDVTETTIPLVSAATIPIVSSETIPLISGEILDLTILDVISSNTISSAIIDNSTAIGYGVYSAISSLIDDVITDEMIVDLLENEALSSVITSTISSDASNIWDILTDGSADNAAEIDAGGA